MSFERYFNQQLEKHASMQFSDVVKLCYQAAFGAEHLLSDFERARSYLMAEFDAKEITDEPIFELISDEICRVNLGAWKREKRALEPLFDAFVCSAQIENRSKSDFLSLLDTAECVMKENKADFDLDAWRKFLEEYKKAGMPPIHHSDEYRSKEKPSYRIVKYSALETIL